MYVLVKDKEKKEVLESYLCSSFIKITLNKKLLNINNQSLIDKYYLKKINKEMDKLLKETLFYLTEEDDDQDKTGLFYDELALLRSIILKKYEKELSIEARNVYMKKIRFLALELKKRLKTYSYEKTSRRSR